MDWLKENWDKAVLLAVGLVAIGVSVMFVLKAQSYPKEFGLESVTADNTLAEPEENKVVSASNFLDNEIKWVLPIKGQEAPKPLPLFVSIPIVEVAGELVDMNDPKARSVRPPASNKWLIDNGLDFLDGSVMSKDPDGDEFSNEEEWDAKTDPNDPASHPSYVDKLFLSSRQQRSYRLIFQAMPDDQRFQIRRVPTNAWPQQQNFMLRQGEASDDNQFRVESIEKKEGRNNLGITVDASELTITYLPTGEKFKITRGVEFSIPTYFAIFDFALGGGSQITVKKGESFVLPVDPDTKYTLLEVEETEAEISFEPEPGRTETRKIGKKN